MGNERVGMLFNFTSYSFSLTASYPSPVNHLHFPRHGFFIFNLHPHHSLGAHPDSQAHNPRGWGFSVLHFIPPGVPRDPRPCEHPTPPGKDGSQARGAGGGGLQGKKGENSEGGYERETAGGGPDRPGERQSNCALVPIRGFRHGGKSALRPPHPFPRPRETRGGGCVSPRLPRKRIAAAHERRGPARGSRAPASASHLSDARPGAVPHGFLQPRVAAAPGCQEEPERPGARDGGARAARAAR